MRVFVALHIYSCGLKNGRAFMEVSFIYKIAAVGMIVAVINQILQKSGKDEYSTMTTVAGIILVILMLLPKLSMLSDEISSFFGL